MKNQTLGIFFLIITISQSILAGGYAGNGAGLVEQNFNYVYSSLPRLIESSIATIYNQFNDVEQNTLLKIESIVRENSSNAKRLVFLSGQKHPEIFNTSETELHRLAVTTFTPGDIIYVNGDLLYSQEGRPNISIGEIVAVLVHEVGHQAGEKDHQFLDIIGAKIRNYYNQNSLHYDIEKDGRSLVFSILNHKGLYSSGQIIFQNGSDTFDLTPIVLKKIKLRMQQKKYLSLTGFNLTNGHFKLERLPQHYIFQIWIQGTFTAKSESGSVAISDLIPIEFEIDASNTVK